MINTKKLWTAIIIILVFNGACAKRGKIKSRQNDIIDRLLKGYSKNDPPLTTNATEVKLGVIINSFYSISEATMDYMVSLKLLQEWKDPRLKFSENETGFRDIKLGEGWKNIWIPDTFFRNEKKANFHDVTVANRMLRLKSSGTLLYATKISATFSCQMKLQNYPLDTQICPISIESFGYTSDTMYFAWMENDQGRAIDLGNNKQLPQFTLENFTQHDCSQNYTAGIYPCLEVRFVLRRDIGFFLIQVYVPSILIVILSWVSFWINIESSPARVSIGLLTVLTTTTMSAGARASLPRVSYIKAIDVWMIICLIFVFASLIEYAVVNVMSRKKSSNKSAANLPPGRCAKCPLITPMRCGLCLQKVPERYENNAQAELPRIKSKCNCIQKCEFLSTKPESDGKKKARNIDKLSRKCFPLAFIFFNIIYWTAYTLPSSGEQEE